MLQALMFYDMLESDIGNKGATAKTAVQQVIIKTTSIMIALATQVLVGETGASCYRGRLLQGHFMQHYYIDGEIADSCSIIIHQGNH